MSDKLLAGWKQSEPPAMPTVSVTGDQAIRPGPVHVLLIEDDEGDAVLVREWLRDSGQPVRLSRARSLGEAIGLLNGIDCVLLDLGLPDAQGLDGVDRLRQQANRVAVIVLTGLDDERLGIAAVAAGAQDYLVKDKVDGAVLARTIRYAVQRRRAEDVEAALREERQHARENALLERGLLPKPLVRDAGMQVTSRYRSGGQRLLLGGDFFDVVQNRSGAIHMIIGDVAGHGPDEAALGVALRIAWRALVIAGRPMDEILTILDEVLIHERQDDALFATVCVLSVAPSRRTATMYLAGHHAPIMCASGGWTRLPQLGGPSLGLLDQPRWPPVAVELPAGEWALLLYTDGLIEGHIGRGDDRLGTDGLLRLVAADTAAVGAVIADTGNVLDRLIAQVTELNAGPLTDDLALLVVAATEATGDKPTGDNPTGTGRAAAQGS